MIEVQYVKVTDMNSNYWRYTPFLKDISDDEELRERELNEWENELSFYKKNAVLNDVLNEDHYERFLEHYIIAEKHNCKYDTDTVMWVLKKRVYTDLNAPLVLIRLIAAEVDIRLSEGSKVLKSHPVSGRLNEYLILEGRVEFNTGGFNEKEWIEREAIIENIHLESFERKYKKIEGVLHKDNEQETITFTVFQNKKTPQDIIIINEENKDQFETWWNRVDQCEIENHVEAGIYQDIYAKLYYVLGTAIHIESHAEYVIHQQLFGEMDYHAILLDDFKTPLNKEEFPNLNQEFHYKFVSK